MIVVSDTSPLTALMTIGADGILPRLFDSVVVPGAVRDELLRGHAVLPEWLSVVPVEGRDEVARLAGRVDLGEAEAIVLAKEQQADWLLIDERKGRRLAQEEGIPVMGLLGVVLLAKRRQLIASARATLDALQDQAGVYLANDLRETALETVGE